MSDNWGRLSKHSFLGQPIQWKKERSKRVLRVDGVLY
jgi:hypothetical protein